MSDADKKNSSNSNELDEFTRALLNRRTEMRLYPEDDKETDAWGDPLSEDEKETASQTMSEALDEMRRQRGQNSIQEEEALYEMSHGMQEGDAQNPQQLVKDILEQTRKENLNNPKKAPSRAKKKKNETKQDAHVPASKPKWVLYVVLFLFACALGLAAYSYKILYYNPTHTVSEAQQAAYDALIDYADEYGSGLMSDAEKLEILDLKEGYDSLLESQKKEVNAYFQEQTKTADSKGYTFEQIYNEQLSLKQQADDRDNPDYQQITAFLSGWDSMSEEQKQQIVNYNDMYSRLSATLQAEVDDLARQVSGQSFASLVSQQEEAVRSAQVAQQEEEAAAAQAAQEAQQAQIAQWQQEAAQLNQELSACQIYAQSLAAELASAQAAGTDTSAIQSQIDANNQTISSLESSIAYTNSLIAANQ